MIVPVPIAKTLLKFASSDKKRPNIYGVGVTEKGLSATDGFCSVVFTLPGPSGLLNMSGKVIDRKWFETEAKLAAVRKEGVDLGEGVVVVDGVTYPNVEQLQSEVHLYSMKVNAQYMQLISMAADACNVDSVGIHCTRPLRFEIVGPTVSATVLISVLRNYA